MQVESIMVNGLTINGYSSDYVFQTIKQTSDFYESAILKKWTPYVENAKFIFDIGANLGNHTLYWATETKCEAVYSFEPFKPNFEVLKANVEDNKLCKVVLINKGVGAKNGFAKISLFDESNYGGTTLSVAENHEDGIELVSIDSFVLDYQLKKVDFVKIDTEGFEVDILAGMRDTLAKYRPDLWIEVTASTFSDVLEIVEDFGYVLSDIEGCNILLLNKQRHDDIYEYSKESAIVNMFLYLEKANNYYKNYLTAKGWLSNKDVELGKCREALNIAERKYKEATELYKTAKTWVNKNEIIIESLREESKLLKQNCGSLQDENLSLKKDFDHLQKENTRIKQNYESMQDANLLLEQNFAELHKEYAENLQSVATDYEHMITVLSELNRKIQTLEVQNGYLKSENNEYRRKLSLITDTKWGRLAIKIYRKLQYFKAKLKK